MGSRLALLIATYEYSDPDLRQLAAPGHDAEALAEVLRDGDIADFGVTMLINEPHYRVGEAIGRFYRDRRRDDLALLYFTGHGLKDDSGQLYLAMSNTQRASLLFTALSADQIDQAMTGCASRQKVLVLDCCYSGAFPAGKLAKADPEVHTLERFHGRGRTVLTASDATQYSFEGDTLHGAGTRSVFTRHLVAGLRDGSADLDGDGDITLDELYAYVHDRVVEEMPQQRPKKQDNVEGRTVIARNINWSLPTYLRNAIDSPIATDRLAALDGLDHLYRIGNASVRDSVRAQITRLADDDSRTVSAAAAARLDAFRSQESRTPTARLDLPTVSDTMSELEGASAEVPPPTRPSEQVVEDVTIDQRSSEHVPTPTPPEQASAPEPSLSTVPPAAGRTVKLAEQDPERRRRPDSPPRASAPQEASRTPPTPPAEQRTTSAGRPKLAAYATAAAAALTVGFGITSLIAQTVGFSSGGDCVGVSGGPTSCTPSSDFDLAAMVVMWGLALGAVAVALVAFIPRPSASSRRQRLLFLPGILGCGSLAAVLIIAAALSSLRAGVLVVPLVLLVAGLPTLAVVGTRTGVWRTRAATAIGLLPAAWFIEAAALGRLFGVPELALLIIVAVDALQATKNQPMDQPRTPSPS